MKASSIVFMLLGGMIGLVSCKSEHSSLGHVSVVEQFPVSFQLESCSPMNVEIPGIYDIKCEDDTLYCLAQNPAGMLSVLDLAGLKMQAQLLHFGRGPMEIMAPLTFNSMAFSKEKGETVLLLNNMQGKVLKVNVSRSVKAGDVKGNDMDSVPPSVARTPKYVWLKDGVYFYHQPSANQLTYERGFIVHGEKVQTVFQKQLNNVSVSRADGFLFNILGTNFGCNRELGRMVEASVMLNTIYLYDFDGIFSRIISYGGPPSDPLQLEQVGIENLPCVYQSVRAFPHCFVALYRGDKLINPLGKKSALQFFDWEGSPLAEVEVPILASSFDIDFAGKKLFALETSSEKLYCYDLTGVLKRIHQAEN